MLFTNKKRMIKFIEEKYGKVISIEKNKKLYDYIKEISPNEKRNRIYGIIKIKYKSSNNIKVIYYIQWSGLFENNRIEEWIEDPQNII